MARSPRTVRRASVIDVAQLAGVSVGTVSNVLNRPELVAAPTRKRVESAIAKLSFVPNGAARRLRAGAITTVASILLDIRNPFFTEMARGIEERLAVDNHTLLLASSNDDPDRERRYLRLYQEHGVLGLLIVPGSSGLRTLRRIHEQGMSMVLLDSPGTIPGVSTVSVDDQQGAALAIEHLLSMGHRRIHFLNGPHAVRQCNERYLGAVRAIEARGLSLAEVLREVTLPTLDSLSGQTAMRDLIERDGIRPTAVFCVNDLVALGVQRALRLLGGTKLLTSVAVVGYDDLDICAELAVPLTSVKRPAFDMGYRGADLLLAVDRTAVQHVVFQPDLVVRASSSFVTV